MLAKTGVMTAISGGLGVTGQKAIDQKRFELKQGIDIERGKPDTPGYNNITELKQAKREQNGRTNLGLDAHKNAVFSQTPHAQ